MRHLRTLLEPSLAQPLLWVCYRVPGGCFPNLNSNLVPLPPRSPPIMCGEVRTSASKKDWKKKRNLERRNAGAVEEGEEALKGVTNGPRKKQLGVG